MQYSADRTRNRVFGLGNPTLTDSAGTIALLAANLYVFCFGFSWGPVTWVLLGEMFNNRNCT
ncbi:MFS transporter [Phormidium pseudopriestleyi]|uniref:MFS transporter n=1 Tax=Phormidium pseudopriestleyi TaxID=1759527 RepID=UPI0030F3E7D2